MIYTYIPSATTTKSQTSHIDESKDEPVASPPTTSGPALAGSVTTGDAATGDDLTTHTTPSDFPQLSDTEARLYYYGLQVRLVARTGSTPWEEPTGPEESWREDFRGASSHRISKIWGDVLAPQVRDILKEAQVDWTSLEVARIGYEEECFMPVVLWIGIDPDSKVPYKVNYDTAVKCKQVLVDNDIDDVEVEMHESRVIRYWS